MRFTRVLYQQNYLRLVRRLWKKEGRLQVEELNVPPSLIEMGVPIMDAKEILHETKLFKKPFEEMKPVIPIIPSLFQQEKYFYVMHYKTKVSENENQTLCLTKTIPYQGLPSNVSSLIGRDSLPNQDDLVQTSLLQAQVWDADQDKLPKKIDVLRPGYVFRRLYGIRQKKKVLALLEKLTHLCECASGKYNKSLHRSKLFNTFAEITISRNGDIIGFRLPSDILLTSKEPLSVFASPSEVEDTENEAVPNIYPIKSTLDLDKLEEMPTSSLPQSFDTGHLHTIFIAQKSFGWWFPKQLLARAIATCFSFSALKAKQIYGENVAVLPESVCVQCVYMDSNMFNFITYQLNTLDLDHNEGVKNQVWIDEAIPLYESVSEKDLITGYNRYVFPKMLGLYLNGLLPVDA